MFVILVGAGVSRSSKVKNLPLRAHSRQLGQGSGRALRAAVPAGPKPHPKDSDEMMETLPGCSPHTQVLNSSATF